MSDKKYTPSVFAKTTYPIPRSKTSTLGDFGLGSMYNIGTQGDLGGEISYKTDDGSIFGVRGNTRFNNDQLFSNPKASAFANIKLGENLDLLADITHKGDYSVAAKAKLGKKLGLRGRIDNYKNWDLGADVNINDKLSAYANLAKDSVSGGINYQLSPNMRFSGNLGKRGNSTNAKANLVYTY